MWLHHLSSQMSWATEKTKSKKWRALAHWHHVRTLSYTVVNPLNPSPQRIRYKKRQRETMRTKNSDVSARCMALTVPTKPVRLGWCEKFNDKTWLSEGRGKRLRLRKVHHAIPVHYTLSECEAFLLTSPPTLPVLVTSARHKVILSRNIRYTHTRYWWNIYLMRV